MKVYGNHCNAGTIHRELQPAFEAPVKPLPVIAPPERTKIPTLPKARKRHKSRAVICVETGQRFESCALAAEAVGVSAVRVRQASSPHYPGCITAGGYHWRRA